MTMRPPLAYESEDLFSSLDKLRAGCLALPPPDADAAALAAKRQSQLTKPPGSLGRLEDIVLWLARWQGRSVPRLDRVDILVFVGNHGVTKQGVSAYPAEVTAQMVANFSAGGAAINQIARTVGANLHVVPLALEQATADFTQAPAMTEGAFLAAVATGYKAVSAGTDLVSLLCSISECDWAREPALRWPCRCCVPHSPVTPEWRPSPRRALPTNRAEFRRGRFDQSIPLRAMA
jgi:hypothetical protein